MERKLLITLLVLRLVLLSLKYTRNEETIRILHCCVVSLKPVTVLPGRSWLNKK